MSIKINKRQAKVPAHYPGELEEALRCRSCHFYEESAFVVWA